MMKKAGIVVAATTAALLAVSPLAFAGDEGDLAHGGMGDDTSKGLINLAGNDVNLPIEVCNTDVPILAVDVEDVAGAIELLGEAEADSGDGEQRTCEADDDDETRQNG